MQLQAVLDMGRWKSVGDFEIVKCAADNCKNYARRLVTFTETVNVPLCSDCFTRYLSSYWNTPKQPLVGVTVEYLCTLGVWGALGDADTLSCCIADCVEYGDKFLLFGNTPYMICRNHLRQYLRARKDHELQT